jgi:hypothetical protein
MSVAAPGAIAAAILLKRSLYGAGGPQSAAPTTPYLKNKQRGRS